MSNHINTTSSTKTVLWNGLEFAVSGISYWPSRPAPFAQTPDSPGYSDPGDYEEIEFDDPVFLGVDCEETFKEFLNLQDNESFTDAVVEVIKNGD